MPDLSEGALDLESRLADIDRRLREIQAELAPEREPRPTRPPSGQPRGRSGPLATVLQRSARERGREADPAQQIEGLSELHDKLLASMHELLERYEAVLRLLPAPDPRPAAPDGDELTVSVGPFATIEALREFERALAGLPGVREVAVRGFEGSDRAIVDVQLEDATS
jgi:hypothetical protein